MDLIDTPDTIRFSESCRLCLRKPGIYNVFKIKGLLLEIYEFTGVKVFLAGNLPQTICRECSILLQRMKELKEIATTNDAHMRSMVSDQLAPSKQIEQLFVEELNSDPTYADDKCVIKTERDTLEAPTSEDDPRTSQVSVRSDFFSSPETESPLVTDFCPKFPPVIPDSEFKPYETYTCEICEKNFTTWKKFYYHNRFHNKSIQCIVTGCTKKFAARGDLEKHMRTHTGEKPYECEVCARRFTQKGTLRVHRVMVHRLTKEVIVGI